jgi:hypothetical protein
MVYGCGKLLFRLGGGDLEGELGNILFGSGIMVCLLLKIMDENKWWEN